MKRACFSGVFFLLLVGCASPRPSSDQHREPAQNNLGDIHREIVTEASCQFAHPLVTSQGTTAMKESALAGFLVGPRAALLPKDPAAPTLRPFFTDGCSASPDGMPMGQGNSEIWVDCCVKHDTMYWLGGPESDKDAADNFLAKCMGDKGYPDIGKVYQIFVQKFGGPDSNKTYRWGYGWNYQRPYGEITAAEEAQVRAIYGVGKDTIQQVLYNEGTPIVRMCSYTDAVFNGFSTEEKAAYAWLNSRIKKDTLIEWAHWSHAQDNSRELDLRLQGCQVPTIFVFNANVPANPQVSGGCE